MQKNNKRYKIFVLNVVGGTCQFNFSMKIAFDGIYLQKNRTASIAWEKIIFI